MTGSNPGSATATRNVPAANAGHVDRRFGDEHSQRVGELVNRLRERRGDGLSGTLSGVLAERNSLLASELSPRGRAVLDRYDDLLIRALSQRYDKLDQAVRETNFAIAEIDGVGRISYANPALERMVSGAVGYDFASLFGPRSDAIRRAIRAGASETLRVDLHHGNGRAVHLRGEIGPLTDEFGQVGAYALLLSVEGEQARFNASPDAIFRVDPEGMIVEANVKAEELLGKNQNQLARPTRGVPL